MAHFTPTSDGGGTLTVDPDELIMLREMVDFGTDGTTYESKKAEDAAERVADALFRESASGTDEEGVS